MSYLGTPPPTGNYRKLDDISSSFNSSTSQFSMTVGGDAVRPTSVYGMLISVDNIVLNPGIDFYVSGSTLIFATAPATSALFFGIFAD